MTNNVIRWGKPLTSLRLTVFCFACAMILVFLGTLDQVNIGVYEAESRYFKSFFLYFTLPGATLKIPWVPSGYLVGGLLLMNLIAAHLARFKFTWKKAGILVLHTGVILLLLGQLFTSLFQVESQMRLDQGETKNYSLSYYHNELAVIDTSAPDFDQVISIPDSQLYKGHKIGLPADSLEVGIDEYFSNSALFRPNQLPDPSRHEDRETLIYMNHPLRYQGLTFYQSGFDNNDTTTILQVVQNPSWLIPYVSCSLIALGMVIQFGMHLTSFVRRRVIS